MLVTMSLLTCLLLEDMMKRWRADIKARQGLAKAGFLHAALMLDGIQVACKGSVLARPLLPPLPLSARPQLALPP